MAFTMFTSTPKEKIMKGQKKYYLLPGHERPTNLHELHRYYIENEKELEEQRAKIKKIGIRKTNVDMSRFG